MFAVGLLAMFLPAPITFAGAASPTGVAAANRVPHVEPSPTTPPAVSTQLARMSASVSSCATGTVMPAGTFSPGTVPVEVFA
jgi:hypothetical protein